MKLRRIDVVQYGWNMFDRRMQREIFPWCTANGVGVMAYGSLAYGMLAGAFHADMQFDETDWRSKRGVLGGLNLFRTMFGPDHFATKSARGRGTQGARSQDTARRCRNSRCAGRSATRPSTPASSASAVPPKWRRTSARSALRSRKKTWWRWTRSSRATTSSTEPPGWLEDDPVA